MDQFIVFSRFLHSPQLGAIEEYRQYWVLPLLLPFPFQIALQTSKKFFQTHYLILFKHLQDRILPVQLVIRPFLPTIIVVLQRQRDLELKILHFVMCLPFMNRVSFFSINEDSYFLATPSIFFIPIYLMTISFPSYFYFSFSFFLLHLHSRCHLTILFRFATAVRNQFRFINSFKLTLRLVISLMSLTWWAYLVSSCIISCF